MKAREYPLLQRTVQEGLDAALHGYFYRQPTLPTPHYMPDLAAALVQGIVDKICEVFELDGGDGGATD